MYNFKRQRVIMKDLLDNGELLNLTIKTEDGGLFKIHAEFLAAMSPYILRNIMASKNALTKGFLIPGISKNVMKNIINCIYTGQLILSMNTVSDLAKAGEIFGISSIVKMCQKYLLSNLNVQNCLKVFNSADFISIAGLKDEVRPYILRNFQQIFPISSDYLNLDFKDLALILSTDTLNVTEDYVFLAILRWIEYDPVSRMKLLPDLMRCIRFGLCSLQFYENNIQSHQYIQNSEECQTIILQTSSLFEAISPNDSGRLPYDLLDMRHPFLRPRSPAEIIFVMGGWSAGSATNVIETYDVKCGRWFLSFTPNTIPRAYHGMLWHGGYIYVIGGFDGSQCFNDVRRFNPVSKVWEERGCMHVQRCYVSVAVLGNYIYAMGGYDGHHRSRSCERYDSEFNQWTMMANMNQVRSDASADTLNGKIYIAGGFNGRQVLDSAEYYDPEIDTWTAITNMTSPRSGVKLAAYNGCIFIIGGFNGEMRLQTVEKYDPGASRWIPIPDMNGPRSNFATAVMYDCLYVIGGFNGLSTITLVERYDHRKNAWTVITELNLNRSALAACTVKDIPNAAEYTFLGNAPSQ